LAPSLVVLDVNDMAASRLGWVATLFIGLDSKSALDASATSFEAVYNAHYRDVFRHAILTTRGRDDVEEIVAETFTRAFAAWRTGHGPAGRPLPWLLVIARRIATDRWRRQRLIAWLPLPDGIRPAAFRGRELSGAPEPASADRAHQATEFWMWLDALSQALPGRQRVMRQLFVLLGETIGVDTLERRHHPCVERLLVVREGARRLDVTCTLDPDAAALHRVAGGRRQDARTRDR